MNTSDLADPMIMAIMTSGRTKSTNAQNFRKWRRRLSLIQLSETDFPIIPASSGIVLGSQGVTIIVLSYSLSREVSRF